MFKEETFFTKSTCQNKNDLVLFKYRKQKKEEIKMARTIDTLYICVWTNLINRANKDKGCRQSNPYNTINNIPVKGGFITRQARLVTNRIRDGDFLCVR